LLAESSPSNQFATLVCVKASRNGTIEVVNAGHLPPVLIKHGMKGLLEFAGLPLGMFADAKFSSTSVHLRKGDSLVLFTDGVTESVNNDGLEFGLNNLLDAIECSGSIEPRKLLSRCLDKLTEHRGEANRFDDLSMLALTFEDQNL
jgi:sigma-B regulation protein RsbU (phosphoserine phosphatase)